MSIRAVLIDNDGVLVNTEETAVIHDIPFLQKIGLTYTQAEYAELISGKTLAALMAKLEADCVAQTGRSLPPGFQKLLQDEHARQVRDIVSAVPGAVQMIETLHQMNVPLAVCSNGEMTGLCSKLQKANLLHRFTPHVYNKDHVNGVGKPAPDMLLYAMRHLGISKPAECIYIGDSDADMKAASAASMFGIGFSGGSHRAADYGQFLVASGANAVFGTHGEIENFIQPLFRPSAPGISRAP